MAHVTGRHRTPHGVAPARVRPDGSGIDRVRPVGCHDRPRRGAALSDHRKASCPSGIRHNDSAIQRDWEPCDPGACAVLMTMPLVSVLTFAVAAAGCATDLRSRRIPNWLTGGAATMALAYHLWTGGPSALLLSLAGLLVGGAIFFLPFALGGLGGGDVKLLAALGAWAGPVRCAVDRPLFGCRGRAAGDCDRPGQRVSADRAAQRLTSSGALGAGRHHAAAGSHARAKRRAETGLRASHSLWNAGDAMATLTSGRGPRSERGSQLIEFALVLPLLLLVVLGIMDFGLLFQRYEAVTNAAREGRPYRRARGIRRPPMSRPASGST